MLPAILLLVLNAVRRSTAYDFFKSYESGRKSLSSVQFGPYTLAWDPADPYIQIHHNDEPHRYLFRTLPSWPFVTIGYATDSKPPIVDGNFKVDEWTLFETPYQNIKQVVVLDNDVFISGEVWGLVTMATYEMKFSLSGDKSQILFNLTAAAVTGTFNRLFLNYWCDSTENFYGFGVQYTYWNMKGRRIPILVAEQGIGRGEQPLTALLNIVADGVGGDPLTTYAPKALYVTNFNRSVIIENSEMMFFDTRDDDAVVVELWGSSMQGRIVYGRSMLDLMTQISSYTGRMKPLPDWTQEGAIVGLEGGTHEVAEIVEKLHAHNVPVVGVWLQDWVGLRHAYDGDRLLWNWHLDRQYYPQWDETVKKWAADGIRVLTYVNPFFSEIENVPSDKYAEMPAGDPAGGRNSPTSGVNSGQTTQRASGGSGANYTNGANGIEGTIKSKGGISAEGAGRRNLLREGIKGGYFVQHPRGGAYNMRSGSIDFCMLDTTNPDARRWMKDVLKQEMIADASSSGWMADFGEYLPFDAVLHSGQSGAEYHNLYPYEWARINEEAIAEAAAEGIIGKAWPQQTRHKTEKGKHKIAAAAPADDYASSNKHDQATTAAVLRANKSVNEGGSQSSSSESESNSKGVDNEVNEVVYFMRSAWVKSPGATALFWLGDQMVSWDMYDGIKTVMLGFLSGGIGGHTLTHSDIGGYTMQELGPIPHIRTRELLFRWTELTAFGSALLRTHIGSMTSPRNAQCYDDEETMRHFGQFASIFAELAAYRRACMREAAKKGWPLMRPLAAHFAYDPRSWDLSTQYLFGADFLVAPVLDPASSARTASKHARNREGYEKYGAVSVKVYLPQHSEWVHLWTGETCAGGANGRYVSVDAPIGAPPVFYRPDSLAGQKLRKYIVDRDLDALHVKPDVASPAEQDSGEAAEVAAAAGEVENRSVEWESVGPVSSGGMVGPAATVFGVKDAANVVAAPLSQVEIDVASFMKSKGSAGAAVGSLTVAAEGDSRGAPPQRPSLTSSLLLSVPAITASLQHRRATAAEEEEGRGKARLGPIVDYVDPTWMDWLGVAQYVSSWDGSIAVA